MLPSNAYVGLDGRELELAIVALAEKSTRLSNEDKPFEAEQHLLLALKLKKAKKEFHELHQRFFERKYGIGNDEKPAGGQTFQGDI